jgi:NitT/TauT family transport system substrate-binding protein
MPLRFGRSLIVAAVLAVILSAALGAGGVRTAARPLPASASFQPAQAGVSADVAARLLNAEAAKQKQRAGMTNVHFILNWLPNVEFAGLWIAQKYGWWQQAGIHMTFTPWSLSVTPERDVPAQGGNTLGFQSGAAIAIARAKGEPITALYTDTQKSVFGLTVLKKSGITNLRQLKGKRVGYQSHELYVPETMLACVGLKPSDWIKVPVGFDIVQLTAGHVDAYLTFVTNEPISLDMQGIPQTTFPAYKYCFHSYDDVLFTYNGLINSNPALVRKVVSIVAKAYRWAHLHPVQTANYVTQTTFTAPKAKAAQNLRQQTLEIERFAPYSRDARGQFSGLMTTPQWRQLINTLFKYGLIKSRPAAGTIYTNQFNPYR